MTKTEELMEATRRVMLANPDFVYRRPSIGCAYFVDGEPSCAVGHGLVAMGVEDFPLRLNHEGVGALIRDFFGEKIFTPAAYWLQNAQGNQDHNRSWGDAVAEADWQEEFWSWS